jgi:hypothetical protein
MTTPSMLSVAIISLRMRLMSLVALLAAERRPSLTAAAYVYESIIYPGAFIVDDYYNNMPRIYHDQIPDDELGDIIAYLLTPKAEQ